MPAKMTLSCNGYYIDETGRVFKYIANKGFLAVRDLPQGTFKAIESEFSFKVLLTCDHQVYIKNNVNLTFTHLTQVFNFAASSRWERLVASLYNANNNKPKLELSKLVPKFKAISVYDKSALLLTEQGQVYGVGKNSYGQLGYDSANKFCTIPTPIPGIPERICNIYLTERSAFAITADGGVYAWGSNNCLQLGVPAKRGEATFPYNRVKPVKIPGLKDIVAIQSKLYRGTFMLDAKGSVFACGIKGSSLGFDHGGKMAQLTKLDIPPVVSLVVCGNSVTVALTQQGEVLVWGEKKDFIIGNKCLFIAEVNDTVLPTVIDFGMPVVAIAEAPGGGLLARTEDYTFWFVGDTRFFRPHPTREEVYTSPQQVTDETLLPFLLQAIPACIKTPLIQQHLVKRAHDGRFSDVSIITGGQSIEPTHIIEESIEPTNIIEQSRETCQAIDEVEAGSAAKPAIYGNKQSYSLFCCVMPAHTDEDQQEQRSLLNPTMQ